MGEFFGGAVAVADVNGDGKDDIIVGSPLFTHEKVSESFKNRRRVQLTISKEDYKSNTFFSLKLVFKYRRLVPELRFSCCRRFSLVFCKVLLRLS